MEPVSLVYALGRISYEFPSEARRDSLRQSGLVDPSSASALLEFLAAQLHAAAEITWTLEIGSAPLYIIRPEGAHAAQDYERLREALAAQVADGAERHSIPGRVAGVSRLRSGRAAEVVAPVLRGMYRWTTAALVEAASP